MKTLWLLLLLPLAAIADESSIKYGLGVLGSAKPHPAVVKTVSGTWQFPLINDNLIQQLEIGFYTDASGIEGRKASGFGFYSWGLNVAAGYVYAQSLVGFGGITHPDSALGGHFQFTEDLAVGLRDSRGYSIGLNYKHISSAGIYKTNYGRDFLTLRLSIPW